MRAASSKAIGSSAKKALKSQMAKGKLKVRKAMTRPWMELRRWKLRNTTYKGTMTAAIGAIRVLIIQNERCFLPAKWLLANPYPANIPKTTEIKVEMLAANRLFRR